MDGCRGGVGRGSVQGVGGVASGGCRVQGMGYRL